MLSLVGRRHTDDPDGCVLIDQLAAWAVPHRLRAHRETLRRLGDVSKQLNVPFGQFAMDSLAMSCLAVKICGPFDDSTYGDLMGQLTSFTAQLDMLAKRIKSVLAAAVDGQARDERETPGLVHEAEPLLGNSTQPPSRNKARLRQRGVTRRSGLGPGRPR